MFLYSASLTSLPKDIYEAADLDGVNGIQRFFYITLPQLKPTTFFLTVTGIISSFKVFGQINVMTHGGPGSSTYTLVYYIYKSAFTLRDGLRQCRCHGAVRDPAVRDAVSVASQQK